MDAKARGNFLVEVLEQSTARLAQPGLDLLVELRLQAVERGLDLHGGAARSVDLGNTTLDVDPGLQGTEDLVASSEDTAEETQLLGEELEHTLVRGVAAVEEIHDDHVVLLSVAMAATDPLLDALRVPRQVVVHDERAELKVDAFRSGLGRDEDRGLLAEVFDDGRLDCDRSRLAWCVGWTLGGPVLVDLPRERVRVRAIEECDLALEATTRQQLEQVGLGTSGFREDDCLARRPEFLRSGERGVECRKEGLALRVDSDRAGCNRQAPKLGDLGPQLFCRGRRVHKDCGRARPSVALRRDAIGLSGHLILLQVFGKLGDALQVEVVEQRLIREFRLQSIGERVQCRTEGKRG